MGRLFGIPVIVHLHGGGFKDFYDASSSWSKYYIRLVLNMANSIVVLSNYWCKYIQSLTMTPLKIINNFVLDSFREDRMASERHQWNILFLGMLDKSKGVYDLLEVFSKMNHRFPEARLVCGGDGEIDKVRNTVAELGANDIIELPGWVSGTQKDALMHRCGIFVLPSYKEGLPMSIIEAMSHSMAVVSTRVGGIPELVDDSNGFLITPGSQKELSAALIKLLEKDEQTIEIMGTASRKKYLQSFTPEACLSEMRSLYLSLGVTP